MSPKTTPAQHGNAFIDYYNAQEIIPVRQDLTDKDAFIFRRNHLYKTLGMPLSQLKNRNVIEFGPGGGFNATATMHFGPNNYVFVDATSVSIQELKRKQAAGNFNAKNIEIVESNIFDYRDDRKFDVVLCEGVIPCQNDPWGMLKHVGSFCDKGGILITTTMTASSLLSEICRRVMRPSIITANNSFLEQTKIAVELFHEHMASLGVSTRPTEDWVHDMILHDWHTGEYIFTMVDSVAALEENFEFYGSSPRFLVDDRWYKKVTRSSLGMNKLMEQQYAAMNAFLLDSRGSLLQVIQIKDTARLAEVESLCNAACRVHDKIVIENSYDYLEEFITALNAVATALPEEFNLTKRSIADFIIGVRKFAAGDTKADFGSFKQWWGRGQQYISYLNKQL